MGQAFAMPKLIKSKRLRDFSIHGSSMTVFETQYVAELRTSISDGLWRRVTFKGNFRFWRVTNTVENKHKKHYLQISVFALPGSEAGLQIAGSEDPPETIVFLALFHGSKIQGSNLFSTAPRQMNHYVTLHRCAFPAIQLCSLKRFTGTPQGANAACWMSY